jgi:hypothetical protein
VDISRFRKAKSKAYISEQEQKRKGFLELSLTARDAGTASEQQLEFLRRYERVVAEEERRLQSRSTIGKAMDSLFPGMMTKQRESQVLSQMDDELEKEWEAKQARMRQEEAEALERQRAEAARLEAEKASRSWLSRLLW